MSAIRVGGMVLVVALAFAAGCGFFKPEKAKIEDALREGIKEKTGKTADSFDIHLESNGNYVGTAQIEGDPWDVKATIEGSAIRWEAMERLTMPKVEKATKKLLLEQLHTEPENLTISEQGPGKFAGTFSLNQLLYQYTATVMGVNVQVLYAPVHAVANGIQFADYLLVWACIAPRSGG
jgi:hypothetical protein